MLGRLIITSHLLIHFERINAVQPHAARPANALLTAALYSRFLKWHKKNNQPRALVEYDEFVRMAGYIAWMGRLGMGNYDSLSCSFFYQMYSIANK